MAVLLLLHVEPATADEHHALDERMAEHLRQSGGPPPGLMSHVVYPEGGGFVIAEVWRAEAVGRAFLDDVLQPMVVESGLGYPEVVARPVWGFARP